MVIYTILSLYDRNAVGLDLLLIVTLYLSIGYLLTHLACRYLGKKYVSIVSQFCTNFFQQKSQRKKILIVVSIVILVIHAYISKTEAYTGDSRLNAPVFMRLLEWIWIPILSFIIMELFIFIKTNNKVIKNLILLLLIFFCLIFISGKGAFFVFLLSISFAHLNGFIKINTKILLLFFFGSIGFIYLSLFLSYGVSDFSLALNLIKIRILMDSDVYILAGNPQFASKLELNSFIHYIFGPFVKLLGWGHLVSENLGAQIGSILAGRDVATGPQAQLPFLIYTAGYREFIQVLIISLCLNLYVLMLKFGLMLFVGRFISSSLILFPIVQFSLVGLNGFTGDPTGHSLYLIEAIVLCGFWLLTFNILKRRNT